MNAHENSTSGSDEFPVAEIKPAGPISAGNVLQSKMWWITLLCLGLAVYLAWQSHRPTGIPITIDFPAGHGLKVGDALQYRGINVGVVTAIELASNLQGVRASVSLDKSAAGIANEGSEFWIVRPQLSLTSISGLETAVGSKYIAVAPGPAGSPALRRFTGRKAPPTVTIQEEGIDIALRGDESFGINPGSPVTYRGVRVGQILAVELGADAINVVVRARIKKEYQSLLRRGSKFWKTSGVDVDFGFKGFHMSTESLATMAKGGVSFITPRTRDAADLEPIQAGHEFQIYEELDDDWVKDAASLEFRATPK